MGFLERKREERRTRKRVDALVEDNAHNAAEGQAAVVRHAETLRLHFREIEASPLDDYFQTCIVCCTTGAVTCFIKLQEAAAFDFDEELLNEVLQRTVRDDAAWWRACSLLRWGYLAEFIRQNWPDDYDDVIAAASSAVSPTDAETEVIEYGPLAVESPERFQMRLLRLLGVATATGGEDAAAVTMHLTDAWHEAWAAGWEQFEADLEGHYPDGPPSTE